MIRSYTTHNQSRRGLTQMIRPTITGQLDLSTFDSPHSKSRSRRVTGCILARTLLHKAYPGYLRHHKMVHSSLSTRSLCQNRSDGSRTIVPFHVSRYADILLTALHKDR